MSMPTFSLRQLVEAGVHFGHHTRRWNPKMSPFIYGVRNKVHIIDLDQTLPMLARALEMVRDVTARGGRVLFVGTKRQASTQIAQAAARCGQYYVNHRWLGGMLTNWQTISNSIKKLHAIEKRLEADVRVLTKKELLLLQRDHDRLDRALGGIKDMGGTPDVIVVIDTVKEHLAIQEANTLKIPVAGIVDSNAEPDKIDFPIPGNDDASRAIALYCQLFSDAVLDGIQAEVIRSGGDLGEASELTVEKLPTEKQDGNNRSVDVKNTETSAGHTEAPAGSGEGVEKQ